MKRARRSRIVLVLIVVIENAPIEDQDKNEDAEKDNIETTFPIDVYSCLVVVNYDIRRKRDRDPVSQLDGNQE